MNMSNLDSTNSTINIYFKRTKHVMKVSQEKNTGSRKVVIHLFNGLLLLLLGLVSQQIAAGPWNYPDSGFQAQAGVIVNFKPVPRKGNEPLYQNNNANDAGAIFYEVEFSVLPQVANRGDVYLGGAYKDNNQGFGGYTPSKISSPQQPVTRGKALVLIRRNSNDPAVSDRIVFWLLQDGKNLVEKSFPFNVATQLTPRLKQPDSGVVPGHDWSRTIRRP